MLQLFFIHQKTLRSLRKNKCILKTWWEWNKLQTLVEAVGWRGRCGRTPRRKLPWRSWDWHDSPGRDRKGDTAPLVQGWQSKATTISSRSKWIKTEQRGHGDGHVWYVQKVTARARGSAARRRARHKTALQRGTGSEHAHASCMNIPRVVNHCDAPSWMYVQMYAVWALTNYEHWRRVTAQMLFFALFWDTNLTFI